MPRTSKLTMLRLGLLVLLVAGCGNPSTTLESGAAACLTANACSIITVGMGVCTELAVSYNDPTEALVVHFSPAEIDCLAAAGHDCVAAKRCLGGGNTPAPCSGDGTSCAGNLFQQCTHAAGPGGSEGMQTFDCAAYGETCVTVPATATTIASIDCGYGACDPLTTAACVSADGTSGGNWVQSCIEGILQRTDCTRLDASCSPSGAMGPHCRGTGPPCSDTGPTGYRLRCDGTVLVTCLDGQEARRDCAKDHLGCFANVGNTPFDCALGNACNPGNYSATCSGTKLTFCNKGVVQTADCAAAGFSTCNPQGGGFCGS